MYEYNDNIQNNQTAQIVTKEQLKAIKKAEKKAGRKKFWSKIGTGLGVGLAFGIAGGCAFVAVNRTVDYFFPNEKAVVSEAAKEDKAGDLKEENKLKPGKPIEEAVTDSVKSDKRDDKPVDISTTEGQIGMQLPDIVKKSMPSIVSITNKGVQEVRSMFGMGIQQYESTSVGSGIIIGQNDEELLIVSNNHVVENAKSLTVGFVDDEVYEATVKGTEPDLDLAVISVKVSDISDETLKKIYPAVIGDSDNVLVGEQVVAIGNALGYGQSVTTGIVSALDRDLTDDRVDNPLIQTDAAINPGNSGGALLNMNGELIGINCAKIASTDIEGVGYAIPMSSASPIIESLMNRVKREAVEASEAGYIGISGVSVDSATSQMYGIPQGIYIQTVEENSPAEECGLIKSDVVRKFDGITVESISDIRAQLDYYKAGEQVDLLIYRSVDGEYVEKTVTITLGNRKGTALDPENEVNEEPEQEEEAPIGNGRVFEDDLNGFFRNDDGSFGFRFGY